MNAFEIIERMLNSREIAVYDTYIPYGKEQQVRRVNKAETLLAQERARQIAERFSFWLFRDEPRRSQLLNYYNENFCAIRPRHFDGSRMLLPGKDPNIKLQKHQLDAVKRIVHSKISCWRIRSARAKPMSWRQRQWKCAGLAFQNAICLLFRIIFSNNGIMSSPGFILRRRSL